MKTYILDSVLIKAATNIQFVRIFVKILAFE